MPMPIIGSGPTETLTSPANSRLSAPTASIPTASFRPQQSLAEIAIELLNPVSSLQSYSGEYLSQSYQGELPNADQQNLRAVAFTSSFPFYLDSGKNIVARLTIPVYLAQPTYTYPGNSTDFTEWRIRQEVSTIALSGDFYDVHAHMDDISFDVAYGGVNDRELINMVGIAGVLPTSEDGSGARHLYLLGPEIALAKKFEGGIAGGWLKHLTKVLGTSPDVEQNSNLTEMKLFFAQEMGNGWQLLANTNLTYDWVGEKDNKLLLPVGGGVAKTIRIGSLPVRFVVEAQKYLETPNTFGPDWALKFTLTVVDMPHSRF
ncbi:MAG: hypothetical protein WBM99_11630 [Psychromonas sp.]